MSEHDQKNLTRRKFVKLLGAGAVLTPLTGLTACSDAPSGESAAPAPAPSAPDPAPAPETPPAAAPAPTGDLPRIDEDDPQAVALGYKHAAADVDTAKFPRRAAPEAANQLCSNCALYQGGDAQWGGCAIFPGKAVNADGWCSAWAPKG